MGIIYKIEHKISHKIYIGQTRRDLERRIKEHLRDFRGYHIDNALRKHGIESFNITILEEVDNELLSEREIYWISYYDCMIPKGYNNTFGGQGYNHTEETKRKISESLKGRKHTEEFKIKVSNTLKGRVSPMKGRQHGKETKHLMSELRSGENSKVSKPVICLDTGIYYISSKQASEQTGVSRSCICCALKGTQKTAGKLHWVYAEDL